MANTGNPKFTFSSKALPEDTFHVVRFRGTERLSGAYHFEITLLSSTPDVNLGEMLAAAATFTIKREEGDVPLHGVLAYFEQLQQTGSMIFYRAELVPRAWRFGRIQHNQIFLDKTVPEIVGAVLKDGGLAPGQDLEFRVQSGTAPWDYVCQYNESDAQFCLRWMEREGLYFYFDQTSGRDRMIITDTAGLHAPMAQGENLVYAPASGLEGHHLDETVSSFLLRQQPMPKSVRLRDYNSDTPDLDIEATAPVSALGTGEIYIYGEYYRTPSEAVHLATVRAQELLCRERLFMGVSTVPYLRSGYVFALDRHYRQDCNQRYLTIAATHEGSQEAFLTSGLGLRLAEHQDRIYYRNSFTCIPAEVQFRSERKTPRTRLQGTMHAHIDAGGSGQYAELDEHGRYKVILPLDISGRKDGKATAWVRMLQPYAGSDHGIHFPLHKGAEVLLTFIDGNPDRPVIVGAVPNPETPSPVRDATQSQCRITTGGQNKIHMEDREGSQGIYLSTPTHGTSLQLGAAAGPKGNAAGAGAGGTSSGGQGDVGDTADNSKDELGDGEWGVSLVSEKGISIQAAAQNSIILGNELNVVAGGTEYVYLGSLLDFTAGLQTDVCVGGIGSYHWPSHWLLKGSEEKAAEEQLQVIEAKQAALGTYNVVHGEHGHVTATVTGVSAQATQAIADSNAVTGAIWEATGDMTEALGNRIDAVGSQTRALGNNVQALGNCVRAAGNQLSNAGIKLQNNGSEVVNSGSTIHSAGSSIKNAGMMMRDAPIIMDN